ncbi:MAG: hypothetical protein A2W29_10590 [Gemmatimonadetes bacterium RBG_16_66_8]|nr:MAG: hypothetical protein A2W29_10590 [Gemmatimonadetes bacterium RBG_16_66_8]
MIHETVTSLLGPDVLERATRFFAERVPQHTAHLQEQGPSFAVFRGQGGEEIALAVQAAAEGTRVRASTLLFDQAVGRFFSTLPGPAGDA